MILLLYIWLCGIGSDCRQHCCGQQEENEEKVNNDKEIAGCSTKISGICVIYVNKRCNTIQNLVMSKWKNTGDGRHENGFYAILDDRY